ncbi:MAG: cellulase family glycosylhydrolase, partial [Candidatus Binatia bacterium]
MPVTAAAAAVAVALALLGGAAANASFTVDAPFLRDSSGRAVFFHGVNAVWKLAPDYFPPSSVYRTGAVPPADSYFDERDAAFLAANGLTTVRLGVMWAGVEPEKDQFDESYLDRIEDLVDMLGKEQILVLLDFHQDMYNELYEGQGFPPWATPSGPLPPNLPFFGFPGGYFLNPATMHAFDRMWLDADGLWAEYRAFWRHIADRFKAKTNLLGYDLMNEPWPGTQWPSCVNTQG